MRRVIHGKSKFKLALVPFENAPTVSIGISTYTGNVIFNKGDGTSDIIISPSKLLNYSRLSGTYYGYNYSPPFYGNFSIKAINGLSDIYSISIAGRFNIENFETFINQFTNLNSLYFSIYTGGATSTFPTINGNLFKLPPTFRILNTWDMQILGNWFFDLNEIPTSSLLEVINIAGANNNAAVKITGNLFNLPQTCYSFKVLFVKSGSWLTYSPGKVWANKLDVLNFNFPLTIYENDNLLIDLNNSVNTAVGEKLINLYGFRTSVSDSAVGGLITKGFTVNCERFQKILDLPFQNSFIDVSASSMTLTEANSNGLPSFVAGPKGSDYAVNFDGNRFLTTALNLPLGTDKVSLSFWIKTPNSTPGSVLLETSPNLTSNNNAFGIGFNNFSSGKMEVRDRNLGDNVRHTSLTTLLDWTHVVIIIDRSLSTNQIKILYNKIEQPLTTTYNQNSAGVYKKNWKLNLGGRQGLLTGSIFSMSYLKIFNYPLSTEEITYLNDLSNY